MPGIGVVELLLICAVGLIIALGVTVLLVLLLRRR